MKRKVFLVSALIITGLFGMAALQSHSEAEVSNSTHKPLIINKEVVPEKSKLNLATGEVGISFTADFPKGEPLLMKDIDKVLRDRLISDAKMKFDKNQIAMNTGDIVDKEFGFIYTSDKLKECYFNNNGLPAKNEFDKNKEYIDVTVKIDKPSTKGHKTQYHFTTYVPEIAFNQ